MTYRFDYAGKQGHMRESTLQGPASFEPHAVRLIPPLHLQGHSTFRPLFTQPKNSPASSVSMEKWAVIIFPRAISDYLWPHILFWDGLPTKLSFILSTGRGWQPAVAWGEALGTIFAPQFMFSTSGGWEFSSEKRGATTTAERIPNQSWPQRGPRSGCKNITASGIFGRQTTLRAFYNLMGKRMDINDKKSVSFESLPEFRIWTKMPSSGLNRSPRNDGHLYSVKALEFDF